ncbi:transcription activator MBF2 domain-containing protein [Phthorimaea operculella]|nr:transcription activator MBF2 domain-containing protein [Phthorimaea operculella]
MKLLPILSVMTFVVVMVESHHYFAGSNVMRNLVMHKELKFGPRKSQNRVEFYNYTLPFDNLQRDQYIAGLLVYDKMNSAATVEVVTGGLGHNYLQLRMMSERGKPLKYDVYVYT